MRYLIVLCFFAGLITNVIGQSIRGVVRDQSGKAIPRANIVVEGTESGSSTMMDGTFSFETPSPGTYRITASHVGYISHSLDVRVQGEGNQFLTFILVFKALTMHETVISAEAIATPEMISLPVRTKLLDLTSIQSIPAISATNLLETVSGVTVSSEFGMFSSSSVSLRGVGGNSQGGTLVVFDGIPLNKADGGSVNWNIIDKDVIEKIEIVKGSASALYGSNAMGGIITIISKKPTDTLSGKVSLSYGTYNTMEGKAELNGAFQKGKIFWRSFAHYRKSDGYINTPDEIIRENDSIVIPVFLEEFFVGGLLGFHLNEKSSLEFSMNYFEDIRGRGTRVFEEIGSNTRRDTWQSHIKYKGKIKAWNTYATVFMLNESYFRLNEYLSDGEYKLYEVDSQRDDMGFRFQVDRKKSERCELILGAESRLGRVHAIDTYFTSTDIISNDGSLDIFALFTQYRYRFRNTKWEIVTGLRYDFARFYNGSFSIQQPSYSIEYFADYQFDHLQDKYWGALSPKFTLHFQADPRSEMYFSLSKGFRAPILDDLCRSEKSRYGLRVANQNLKPEHIYTTELGFDKTIFSFLKLEVSAYYTAGYNFMNMLSTGDSVNLGYTLAPIYKMSNISKVDIFGFEADMSTKISNRINAWCNYTFICATIAEYTINTEADRDLNGKFLANIPAHSWSAGSGLKTSVLNAAITGKFTGQRWINDDNSFDNIYLKADKFESYFTTDVKIWKKIAAFECAVDVNNVFNVVYINSKGYKSPGRMIFVKLTYFFKDRKN